MRGRALTLYFDRPEKLEAARRHLEQALQFDPNYAPALAELSSVETQYYRNIDPDESHLQRAEQFARRAMAIDPQLSDAHVATGRVYNVRYEYARGAEEFREAIRLQPDNAYAWLYLAWALGYEQPPDAQGAEKAAREAIRLEPNVFNGYYYLGRAFLFQRRNQEAVAAFEHAKELSPTSTTPDLGIAEVYLAQGDYDRALAVLLELRAERKAPIILFQLSAAYAGRGDKEKALETLQEVLAGGYRDFAAIDANPHFTSLRPNPRFQQLLRRYRQ